MFLPLLIYSFFSPATHLFEPLHCKVSVPHGGVVHVAEASLSDSSGCGEAVRTSLHFLKRPLQDARKARRPRRTAIARILPTELRINC